MTAIENKTVKTDVLIIGGGPAGMWSAKRIKELDEKLDIIIVDKGGKWGGQMTISGGDFDAVLPDEDVSDWVKDLIYYYDGLCEQDIVEKLFSMSYDRMMEYQELGCTFLCKDDGSYKGVPQRGLDHVKLYPAKYKGRGGEEMFKNLSSAIYKKGVKRLGRIMITNLLKDKEKISGAVGFDIRSGEFYIFEAKVVILCCGNSGWKPSYGKNLATGECLKMAFEAGAELRNFEFTKVWNVPKLFSWEGQTTLMPLGARFVNKNGEAFMDKYSPVLGANTDPHYITIAMAKEALAGNAPIYFDISKIKEEDVILIKPQIGWQLMNHEKLCALGIDFFKDNTEWNPQLNELLAGIVTDINGATCVPGLYAAGRSRSIDPGVYIGGFALSTTSTTGYLAAEAAFAYMQGLEHTPVAHQDQIDSYKNEIYCWLGTGGIAPKDVMRKIQQIVFPYDVSILKTEASLTKALTRLESINHDSLGRMGAADPHYLMKVWETIATSFITELHLKASLERKESRAGHYRDDYPERAADGLYWLHVKKNADGKAEMYKRAVPLDTYKYPITRYYGDNFKF